MGIERMGRLIAAVFVSLNLLALGTLILAGSSQSALAQSVQYNGIIVEGNIRIDDESVLRFADLPDSGRVSSTELASAYRRLSDAALFEQLEIVPRGGNLVISVVELPIINEISIEGNKRLEDGPLSELIASEPRHVYRPAQAERDADAIAEAYRVAGRFGAIVTPKIIRRSENRVDLVFEVVEGQVVETERIAFVGNRIFSGNRLRRELASKQAGILRPFVKTDTYLAERIEEDRQNLIDFYLNRGYVDFEILSVAAELTAERDAFFITFTVQEGQQYRFGAITARSEVPEIIADEYLQEFRGQTGQVYTPVIVNDATQRMEHKAATDNFRFVFAEPLAKRDVEALAIDIEFRIFRGNKSFVERIDITGNTTTLDRVIRREFEFAEGDPFNARQINDTAEKIRDLGFFKDVNVYTEPGSTPDQTIVKVEVEEAPTGSLSFGAAWGEDTGVAANVSLSERNLLGRGQLLRLSVETGKNASYSITFVEPRFLDRDVALQLSTSLRTTRGLGQRFSTRQWYNRAQLGFPISERSRLRVGAGFATYKMDNLTSASHIIRNDFNRGKGDRLFVDYGVNMDTRRSGFDQDRGFIVDWNQELARGIHDKSTVLRTVGSATVIRPVLNNAVTLTGTLEGGAVLGVGGDTRMRDRFQMHGGLMRGFSANGMGPRAILYAEADGSTPADRDYLERLGGNYFVAMRLESRFPLGFGEELGVQGGTFADAGSIWGLDDTACTQNSGTPAEPEYGPYDGDDNCMTDDGFKLRSTIGLSLFIDTFFGPLRFNFSRPLKKQPYDTTHSFDLTVASDF
ncbi:MAG: outer membrane protein assembly factor BamA [Rhodobacteraceae bacterium]|nr:outer membrane protein assembly factor BamA [Paracoccaceae bacterium]